MYIHTYIHTHMQTTHIEHIVYVCIYIIYMQGTYKNDSLQGLRIRVDATELLASRAFGPKVHL